MPSIPGDTRRVGGVWPAISTGNIQTGINRSCHTVEYERAVKKDGHPSPQHYVLISRGTRCWVTEA